MPQKKIGSVNQLPPQTETPLKLKNYFLELSEIGSRVPPDFPNSFNSFFGEVTCTIVTGGFRGYKWLYDEIYLLTYCDESYADDKRIYPGQPFVWHTAYSRPPVWAQIGIKTPQCKYRISAVKYERFQGPDFSFLVRFSGTDGWVYARKETRNIIPRLRDKVEYVTTPEKGTLADVQLTIRVTWNGPNSSFKDKFERKICDFDYGPHLDYSAQDYATTPEQGSQLSSGPSEPPSPAVLLRRRR